MLKNIAMHKGAFKSSFVYYNRFYHSFRVEKDDIIHSVSKDGVLWDERYSSLNKGYPIKYIDVRSFNEYLLAVFIERVGNSKHLVLSISKDSMNWVKVIDYYPNDFEMKELVGVKVINVNPYILYVKGLNNNKLCECIIDINSELIEESLTQIPLE